MRSPLNRMLTWFIQRRGRRKQPPVVRQAPEVRRSEFWDGPEPRRPRPGTLSEPDRDGWRRIY